MERQKLTGHAMTLVVFVAIASAVLVVLFRLSGAVSFGDTYDVKAVVPQAGSLSEGTSVTMAGARVGTVKSVSRRGVGALVDIRIEDSSVTPLPKDSTAQLAVRTPLGENYVELVPGRSKQELESGGLVPPRRGSEYVDVDQILSTLQGETRERARQTLQGAAAAFGKRGEELNSTLSDAASVLEAGSGLTARIGDDRREIARLVRQLGDLSQSVGERGESIKALAQQGRTTFTALAQRDDAVRALLDQVPNTMVQLRKTTNLLRSTSDTAAPVVANAAAALREVRPAVRRLAPAAQEGRRVVDALDKSAAPLQGTLKSLQAAAPGLTKALPQVDTVLCDVNPMLRYIKPYIREIVSFAGSLGSASNSYDAIGHTIRLLPVINETALLGAPKEINDAAAILLHTGLAEGVTGLTFRPYPEPGQSEAGFKPGDQFITGPEDYKNKGGKYTRVTSDC